MAFTSDSSQDYTLKESSPFLTQQERAWLGARLSVEIDQLACARQVHGDRVLLINNDFLAANQLQEADALVTNLTDVVIAVRTADCLPVFCWDPVHRAMGVVHAGWKSTHKQILHRTLEQMTRSFQTRSDDVRIAFGPAIQSCCYEVGLEFKEHFPNEVVVRDGGMYMDLVQANTNQLLSIGVKQEHIFNSGICTVCEPGYFSYRRDGVKAGRMISAMMLKG